LVEAVAGEAAAGTLRYLLARPVGRTRLLLAKLIAISAFTVLAVLLVVGSSLAHRWPPTPARRPRRPSSQRPPPSAEPAPPHLSIIAAPRTSVCSAARSASGRRTNRVASAYSVHRRR
jgi:ABC-2 family transporter protein